ncbi:Cation/H+ exchanger [Tribonema minus]|uniref:Cation/H+ exchanger n=1 Tax=Tribonema minus TaxID=303371 RepID=A0A835Z7P1_9STRA|nr:Cation/H+ exchanger [Tribonema minus]
MDNALRELLTDDKSYYDYSIGPILLALALGLLARSHLVKFLPYTVWLLLGGMAIGVAYTSQPELLNQGLERSVGDWINLDPTALFTVFLPVLIFVSAWSMHIHMLQRQIWQILWLAFPAVVVGTALTATFLKYVLYDWDWLPCLLLGTIVSSTDPVATVALLKEQGVSDKLSTLIEGESLFNDGSALVLFELFLGAIEGHELTPGGVPITFVRSSLGGAALGFVLGYAAAQVLRLIVNDAVAEVTLTLVMCHSTWLLAQGTPIGVSGVMAVVLMGLTLRKQGRPFVSPSVQAFMTDFWILLDFLANTVVFFVAGIILM